MAVPCVSVRDSRCRHTRAWPAYPVGDDAAGGVKTISDLVLRSARRARLEGRPRAPHPCPSFETALRASSGRGPSLFTRLRVLLAGALGGGGAARCGDPVEGQALHVAAGQLRAPGAE